jgi:23S rRNA pseudouridine1911/1915/1917 synthase
MDRTETFIIDEDGAGQRLDAFLAHLIPDLTRSAVQRLIEQGHVYLDDSMPKPSVKLRVGDKVQVTVPPPELTSATPEDIPLEILFEDSDLVVVNKPAGMVVHPGAGNSAGTLVNALLGHCNDLSGIGGELRPGIVHRIDKETSGILVVAKSDAAHQGLSQQFSAHTIKRVYIALVFGSMKTDTGKIEGTIGRHPVDRKKMSGTSRHGKRAVTHWRVLARYPGVSLLRIKLETGRTHQIRVHLSENGHPLLGDAVYGGGGRLAGLKDAKLKSLIKEMGRQALHAQTLGFIHPVTGVYLEFSAELPADIQTILDYLSASGVQAED